MRRLRRLYARLVLNWARGVLPRLDRVLTTGPKTVTDLAEDNEMLRTVLREREERPSAELLSLRQDMREAIFLAGGGWMPRAAVTESRREELTTGIAVRESLIRLRETGAPVAVIQLTERLLELELALEDRSWKRLEAQARFEFSRWGIQQIILITRLYRIKNPIIQRGILLSTFYVWGRGVKVGSDDETANTIISECFADPRNATELSHAALCSKNDAKYTDGNIFWCWFVDPEDGQTIFRHIDPIEIEEIITDPNDNSRRWYYHRLWTEQNFDTISGTIRPQPRDAWYVAYGYDPPDGAQTVIKGKPLMADAQGNLIPVYHRVEGGLENWVFGCPRAYAAMDWARAHVQSLEDYCSRVRALSRYGYDIETKGGPPAMAGMKQTMATTLANDLESIETQPPPVTASLWVHGPGTQMKPMRTAGLSEAPEQGMPVLRMAQMVFGLPDTMWSDSQRGNLATAASLDRPTELKFLYDQEIWKQDLSVLCKVVLENSLHANSGKLREALRRKGIDPGGVTIEMQPISPRFSLTSGVPLFEAHKPLKATRNVDAALAKIKIKVEFPAILEGDIQQRVGAIVQAMTLGQMSGITGIDEKVGVELLLNQILSFGFEFDPDEIIESMYPSAAKGDALAYDPARTKEEEPAPIAAPGLPPTPGQLPAAPKPGAPPKVGRAARPARPAPREAFIAAVERFAELIESQRERVEAKNRAA
ncbi:MAG: hypothetical protein ACLPWF_11890 [Bryobacteraceae bacterium]